MSERQLIRWALIDAIDWQTSFAAANHKGPERSQALALVKAYRAILKRRYGNDQTPMEEALDGIPLVPITEIMKNPA